MLRAELRLAAGDLELDVALDVPTGGCLALAGPSGAGKTTILRLIAGIVRADAGRITCGERVWLDTSRGVSWPPERRRCAVVFQDYALFPHLSAWRNVAYGLRSVPRGQRRDAAVALLERFGLAGRADAQPSTLSGGERQRVALARALGQRPSVLLLDEPLAALDIRSRASASREISALLRELEIPSILVTHDFGEAALLGDEIAMIDRGRVVQRGSASELAARPASAFVADFTGAVVLTGRARPSHDQLTLIDLDGGGVVTATEPGRGRVAVSIYPWEITIASPGESPHESAQNRLAARVTSVTTVGNRMRVGLAAGQALVAEVTVVAARELGLAVDGEVIASWKATATRVVELD